MTAAKTCPACGVEHSRRAWFSLALVGYQANAHSDEHVDELRNCACRSTLALAIARRAVPVFVPLPPPLSPDDDPDDEDEERELCDCADNFDRSA